MSAAKALARVAEHHQILITQDAKEITNSDYLVLPGVGAFGDCMQSIEKIAGLKEVIHQHIIIKQRPFLGICVGMQLLAEVGFEHGIHPGFGYIKGKVVELSPQAGLRIPNISWHRLNLQHSHPLHQGLEKNRHLEIWVYFVHSYHFIPENPEDRMSSFHYGGEITASVAKDNLYACQFHPEKSQSVGLKFLENFLNWKP